MNIFSYEDIFNKLINLIPEIETSYYTFPYIHITVQILKDEIIKNEFWEIHVDILKDRKIIGKLFFDLFKVKDKYLCSISNRREFVRIMKKFKNNEEKNLQFFIEACYALRNRKNLIEKEEFEL